METLLFALGGYLIGSIPIGFLLARSRHGIDLRREGSGNIGARNAFEVTGNKRIGFAVLSLDILKGIIPLLIVQSLGYCEMIPAVAVTIVLGHCYPVWLKFHGGRGLATGAAISLMIAPSILLCWIIVYYLSGSIKKQVHLQSFAATVGCIVFVFIAHTNPWFYEFRFICPGDKDIFYYPTIVILFIILSRHIQPLYAPFRKT